MYGIKAKEEESDDEDGDDVEAMIQKQVAALNAQGTKHEEDAVFTPMKMNIDCVLFVKTRAPVEPVEFVKRICQDAEAPKEGQLRRRYVNRLTPVTEIGKASETGVLEVARRALAKSFKLSSESGPAEGGASATEEKEGVDASGEAKEAEIKPSTVSLLPGWEIVLTLFSLPFARLFATTARSSETGSFSRRPRWLTRTSTRSTSRRRTASS